MRRSQVRLLFPAPVAMKSPGLGRGFLCSGSAGRWPATPGVPAHGWQVAISESRGAARPSGFPGA